MSRDVLNIDTELQFPEIKVLKASAGSGKTRALTLRFVQFLLSDRIKGSRPANMVALTFSNNAAREMKERVFKWLKGAALAPDSDDTRALKEILSLDSEALKRKALELIEYLLDNYTELQIMTIDSFLATIFKASSVELGIPPEFEIQMDRQRLFRYCFDVYMKDLLQNEEKLRLIENAIDRILESKGASDAYVWNPVERLLKEIISLHGKIYAYNKEIDIIERAEETEEITRQIEELFREIVAIVNSSELEEKKYSPLKKTLSALEKGMFSEVLNLNFNQVPVKKPRKNSPAERDYERVVRLWSDLRELVSDYARYYVQTYYSPYLITYKSFKDTLETIKRLQGKIIIEDISYMLSGYLRSTIVPDIYLRYGENIHHYLIDEFQDTSPLQWFNLLPLIENSLSEGGSLFVVGDTKQAIYGFRNADYRIMKTIQQENPFPSAKHEVVELDKNYRSTPEILGFVDRVFKEQLKDSQYALPASLSGLTDYHQEVANDEPRGFVEVVEIEKDPVSFPEKNRLKEIIDDLTARGYSYSDIAVLTMENYNVVMISSWLNEYKIPFISYSSLDIRKRKLTAEIVSLLKFLDSPTDDFSFTQFILSSVFEAICKKEGLSLSVIKAFILDHRDERNKYVLFREEFPELWNKYFEKLFKQTGFMPVYDLITEIVRDFDILTYFPDEEATIVRLLEVIKEFESDYGSDLQRFLNEFDSSLDEELWNISVPEGTNAVKVMTVHKAKGLGFPVVILVLYEQRLNKGIPYVITEQGGRLNILKLNKGLLDHAGNYAHYYEEEVLRRHTDALNALYVGLTRAETEMYLLCVKTKDRNNYPFNIIPLYRSSEENKKVLPKRGSDVEKKQSILLPPLSSPSLSFTSTGEDIDVTKRRWGEFIHAILAMVKDLEDLDREDLFERIDLLKEEYLIKAPSKDIYNFVREFIYAPEVMPFFVREEEKQIFCEKEFVDRWGNLLRIDRLIIRPDEIEVIDYKTGDPSGEEIKQYIEQLQKYINTIAAYYKKNTRGFIVSVDQKRVLYKTG